MSTFRERFEALSVWGTMLIHDSMFKVSSWFWGKFRSTNKKNTQDFEDFIFLGIEKGGGYRYKTSLKSKEQELLHIGSIKIGLVRFVVES